MPLESDHARLLDGRSLDSEGLTAAVFGLCWPNESNLAPQVNIVVEAGESILDAAERSGTLWSPQWLIDAGYEPTDRAGSSLLEGLVATTAGRCRWSPEVRLCRVDDQTADNARRPAVARRLAGEVALAALWRTAAADHGIADGIRPRDLERNTRGARFKNILVHVLERHTPAGWRVEPEIALTKIRGLHMRRDVGDRRSDVVVVDDGNRLVAVISSKWTWRSDRGTEAAQMVPLMRYRPDVPYGLVTSEFPRARTVSRESIEDRAYHLCPTWAGAWQAIYATSNVPRHEWSTVEDLRATGRVWSAAADFPGIPDLVDDLNASGTIL